MTKIHIVNDGRVLCGKVPKNVFELSATKSATAIVGAKDKICKRCLRHWNKRRKK